MWEDDQLRFLLLFRDPFFWKDFFYLKKIFTCFFLSRCRYDINRKRESKRKETKLRDGLASVATPLTFPSLSRFRFWNWLCFWVFACCGHVKMRLLHGRAFFVLLGLISSILNATACTELLTPAQVPWTNTSRYTPFSIPNPPWSRNSFDGTQGTFCEVLIFNNTDSSGIFFSAFFWSYPNRL